MADMESSVRFSEDQYKNGNEAVDLKGAENAIEIAIGESVKDGVDAPKTSNGGDDLLSEASLAQVAGVAGATVTAASMFVSEMNSGSSYMSMNGRGKNKSNSIFIDSKGNSVQHLTTGRPTNSMGMKMSYSEAKDAHRKQQNDAYKASKKSPGKGKQAGLVSRANIAGSSLTGESEAHQDKFGAKGAKIDAKTAINLGFAPKQYMDALSSVRKAQNEAPSINQLESGLSKGHNNAEQFMASNPNSMVVQNLHRRLEMNGGGNH